MPFNMSLLSALAGSLVVGTDNSLEKLVMEKIEKMGEEFLKEAITHFTPGLNIVDRTKAAFRSAGKSELENARRNWLQGVSTVKAPGSGLSGTSERLEKAFFKDSKFQRPVGSSGGGGAKTWQGSRQQWLDAEWRHDWRSQPRDAEGRWKAGRLKHPYMTQGARSIRRKRRAAARKAASAFWRDKYD